ncbi:MAG TPA: DinB family protein [Streptosporangiaceae bacterium]
MNEVLVELFRHKTWATLLLIETCQALDPAVLDATTPGTYGTIRDTLQHLVAADESYLGTVTGDWPTEPLPDEPVSLDRMAALVRALGPRWEAVARDPQAGSREITTGDGWRTPASIPIAQAIHHAEAHRGHVLSVLGAHGIETPGVDIGEDFDVWHHGIATGLMIKA